MWTKCPFYFAKVNELVYCASKFYYKLAHFYHGKYLYNAVNVETGEIGWIDPRRIVEVYDDETETPEDL